MISVHVSRLEVSASLTLFRFPLLHERMDEIKSFQSLKSLDLFGCRLGDNHELFLHLTTSSLARYFQI